MASNPGPHRHQICGRLSTTVEQIWSDEGLGSRLDLKDKYIFETLCSLRIEWQDPSARRRQTPGIQSLTNKKEVLSLTRQNEVYPSPCISYNSPVFHIFFFFFFLFSEQGQVTCCSKGEPPPHASTEFLKRECHDNLWFFGSHFVWGKIMAATREGRGKRYFLKENDVCSTRLGRWSSSRGWPSCHGLMSATLARAVAIFYSRKKSSKNHWISWHCPFNWWSIDRASDA